MLDSCPVSFVPSLIRVQLVSCQASFVSSLFRAKLLSSPSYYRTKPYSLQASFGRGRALYKFRNTCEDEADTLELKDREYKLFLNSKGGAIHALHQDK